MKKLLTFVLVFALILSLSIPAFAEEAQYAYTRDLITEIMKTDGFTCTVDGIVSDGEDNYESVTINYSGDLSDYYSSIRVMIAEDESEAQLCMYYLISFDEKDLAEVVDFVNDINAQSVGVKLFVDKSDNSVTAEMYQMLTEKSGVEPAEMAVYFFIGFTDAAYEMLQPYDVG